MGRPAMNCEKRADLAEAARVSFIAAITGSVEGNAAVAGRRRACAQSPARLGAGRCGAQENPRRQSGSAVRILIYYVEPIIESMRLAGTSAASLTFGLAGRQLFCQATSASRRCRRNVASWHKAEDRNASTMSALGSDPDGICSPRAFPLMTHRVDREDWRACHTRRQ